MSMGYRIKGKNGAAIRSGVETHTQIVATLRNGDEVVVERVETNSEGIERALLASPVQGWCSMKMLAPVKGKGDYQRNASAADMGIDVDDDLGKQGGGAAAPPAPLNDDDDTCPLPGEEGFSLWRKRKSMKENERELYKELMSKACIRCSCLSVGSVWHVCVCRALSVAGVFVSGTSLVCRGCV